MSRSYHQHEEPPAADPAPAPPPIDPPAMPDDDAARLIALRSQRDDMNKPALSEDEAAELQRLGAAEAVAAGHPDPADAPAAVEPRALEPGEHHLLYDELVSILAQIAASVPQLVAVGGRVERLRRRLAELREPPATDV